ncbi:MAG: triacylglycerol lipase [Myxococcota bacterium]|jgi:triacylglycerol lipase
MRQTLATLLAFVVSLGCSAPPDSDGVSSGVANDSMSQDMVAAPTDTRVAQTDASVVDAAPVKPLDVVEDAPPAPDDTALPDTATEGDAIQPVDVQLLDAVPSDTQTTDVPPVDVGGADTQDPTDIGVTECVAPRPIVLVHGINGSSDDYEVMAQRLIDAGWPTDYVVLFDAVDPAWGCNVDNATALDTLVDDVLESTGQSRIDLIAHSMGTLSTRYWLKFHDGHERVNSYVTLGGMNHGLASPCWAPDFLGVCVWTELCESGTFIGDLNAEPATPGGTHYVSMYGTADETVPNASSELPDAENIEFDGVEHAGANGLLESLPVFDEVLRVLDYTCW